MTKRPPLVSVIVGSILGIVGGVMIAWLNDPTPPVVHCSGQGVIIHITASPYVDPDTAPVCYNRAKYIRYAYTKEG